MKRVIFGAAVIILGIVLIFNESEPVSEEGPVEEALSKVIEIKAPVKQIEVEFSDNEVILAEAPSIDRQLKKVDKDSLAALTKEDPVDNIPLSEEEMEELEEYFEKVEEEWVETIKNLFTNEFGLTSENLDQYEDIKDGFEEEKLAAFQAFHEKMVAKHGDNYAYRPNGDEKVFEQKVLDEYRDQMRKMLGDDNYTRYTEVLRTFNERIKSEQDETKGVLVIDL